MDWTALAVSAALVAGWTVASERGLRALLDRPAGGSQEPPVLVLAPHPVVLNPGSALPRVLEPAELALLRRAAKA